MTLAHIRTVVLLGPCLLLYIGCANQHPPAAPAHLPPVKENVDSSCSYFYFLWGSNAEYEERYEEALEAFEKAAICDPEAEYIVEKIPVLLIQLGQLREAADWLENYIKRKPQKTVQRFMLARLKIQEDKEEEAITLYEEALGIEPENNNIRLRLGLLYGKKGELEIAESIFLDILEKDPASYFAILYLARLNAKRGKLDISENYYIQALELNWSKELSFELAEFYNLRKQFDKAQTMYSDILCKDDKDERAALGMVQTYLFLQEGEAALQELSRIRNFTNNSERIDLIRAQIMINIGEVDRAKDILIELLKKNQFAQANYLLGVIYFEQLDFENALQTLKRIPANAPEFRESIILQVRILDITQRSDEAIEMLKSVNASDVSRLPVFYSLLASLHDQQGNNALAIQALMEGIQYYSDDELLLYEYAILLENEFRHEEAMEIMKKLLIINPNHADALNFIGFSWADRNINLSKAYSYIKKALELKPNSGYILDSLGWVYFRMGAFNKALEELEKAVKLESEDPYIYEHLGDTHMALGNTSEAKKYYQKALELLNDDVRIKSLQNKLESLHE